MAFPWAAAASLVGGIFQNSSAKSAAQASMDWQERMSNTAHQREVADLRAAGLNPILSANSGASAGSGATFSPVNPAANLSTDINSGRRIDEIEKKALQNQTELNKVEIDLKKEGVLATKANVAKTAKEMALIDSNIATQETNRSVNTALAGLHLANTLKSRREADYFANALNVQQSLIGLQASQAGLANANSSLAAQQAAESLSRQKLNEINQQGSLYDLEKRKFESGLYREGGKAVAPYLEGLSDYLRKVRESHNSGSMVYGND